MTNIDFEALHPRDTGMFAKKGQGAPEGSVALTTDPIIGYQYDGEFYTPEELISVMSLDTDDVEGALTTRAQNIGIDRDDPTTYDSDEFPVPLHASSVPQDNPVVGYRYRGTAYTGQALLQKLNDTAGADLHTVEDLDEMLAAWAFNAAANQENHGDLSDHLPVPLLESEVTVADHPSLGREFWTPAGTTYTSARDFRTKALLGAEPLTASDALDDWANVLKLPEDLQDELWEGTDYGNQSKSWNLEKIADNARKLGLDPETIGMPTRHN